MKKNIYLTLLVLAISCQKDFYLEDLEDVNIQIEQIKLQMTSKKDEEDLLVSKKQKLQEQLADIKAKLNTSEITLSQANKMIQDLESELNALGIGIKDGIYEVVMTRFQRISNYNESYTDPLQKTNLEESEFIEITDSTITQFTRLYYYKINEEEKNSNYIIHRKVVDRNYYTDLEEIDTTTADFYYKIQSSIKRIGFDTLEIVDQSTNSWKEDGEIKKRRTKKFKKLVLRESFPKSKTEKELTDLFKAKNLGFYSDPLYRTLDPSDPMDYIRVFIEDGKRHGVDLSHILNKKPYFNITSIERGSAWASYVCDNEYIWIEYDTPCWEDGLPEPFFAQRIQVMYHELGRSILSYDHPMVENWKEKGLEWPENVADGYNERRDDIMG